MVGRQYEVALTAAASSGWSSGRAWFSPASGSLLASSEPTSSAAACRAHSTESESSTSPSLRPSPSCYSSPGHSLPRPRAPLLSNPCRPLGRSNFLIHLGVVGGLEPEESSGNLRPVTTN